MDLEQHETASQHRYESLKHHIKKGNEMSHNPVNIFEGAGTGAAGMGLGAGLGGGLLGGVLGGALLNNGGLFGNRHGGDFVTPMQLQTATGSIIDAGQNTAVLQGLGDIKAAVPLAESQMQLALAQAQAGITQSIGQTENAVLLGQNTINKNVSDAIAASLASQSNLNVNILQQGSATRDAVNAMGVANLTATANSTKEILEAINAQNVANLQRELTVAELRNAEDRAEARSRQVEVNVSQSVSQNQNQLNIQNQQQAQFQILAQLAAGITNLANDVQAVRQTQSTVNFGTMTGNNQSAQATNNRVN